MAVKAAGSVGTGNSNTPINSLSPTELEVIQEKITEFVKDGAIFFSSGCTPEFNFLGNTYPCPIEFGSARYGNAAAAFEAQKFTRDPSLMSRFTTVDAVEAGRLSLENRDHRDNIDRGTITEAILRAKFSQNPDLRSLLLSTNDAYLVLHQYTGHDPDWSDNYNCTGQNQFGCILMQVRGQLGGRGEVRKPDHLYQISKKQLALQN